MRLHGHSASDDASYVPASLLEEWKAKDPIALFEARLSVDGVLTLAQRADMEAAIRAEIQSAVEAAVADPYPEGRDAAEGVYAP
jgi:TPP-dependent pyruvate/acetoin dehydrogenase alpha subunit